MRFAFTPESSADMEGIAFYLQGLPQTPALSIGRRLQDSIAILTQWPQVGRLDDKLLKKSSRPIRRWVSRPYIIFYYIDNQLLRVVGVIDSRRDVETIMNERLG